MRARAAADIDNATPDIFFNNAVQAGLSQLIQRREGVAAADINQIERQRRIVGIRRFVKDGDKRGIEAVFLQSGMIEPAGYALMRRPFIGNKQRPARVKRL